MTRIHVNPSVEEEAPTGFAARTKVPRQIVAIFIVHRQAESHLVTRRRAHLAYNTESK
jgi:hypothetical protein